jgi:hypothetical protein
VLEDEIGLKLLAPDEGWKNRPDMDPQGARPFRVHAEDFVATQQLRY